jgi:hypothetical protein
MNDQKVDKRAEPYFYIRDHGITSFEEFDEFKEKFPDCSDALILVTWARLMREQHGVSFFGF